MKLSGYQPVLFLCVGLLLFLVADTLQAGLADVVDVTADVETEPVRSAGEAADDAAIWIHPEDSARSLIVGTDKLRGISTYDLAGREVEHIPLGEVNNVAVIHRFPLGGELEALVAVTNLTHNRLNLFTIDPTTLRLRDVALVPIVPSIQTYGLCLYRSPVDGRAYAFVVAEAGQIEQWELFDDGDGGVAGIKRRSLQVDSISEGCVADFGLGYLYVSEESVGIWRFGAEPDAGNARTLVAAVTPAGELTPDVEGLAIYYAGEGGYLIASSQGDNTFVVFERTGDNEYVASFRIWDGAHIDRVTDASGIAVSNIWFDATFPMGLFVVQDGFNAPDNQNYKLVSWSTIARAIDPPLTIYPWHDPRRANDIEPDVFLPLVTVPGSDT